MASRYIHVVTGAVAALKRLGDAAGFLQEAATGLIHYYDVLLSTTRTLVTTDQIQTLTNKTLSNPTITGGSHVRTQGSDLSADGAIPIADADYVITKGSAAALTLAAPTVAQEGIILRVVSFSAFTHAVTFTGNTLMSGTAAAASATCAARLGAGFTVRATGQKWALISSIGQTLA